MAGGGPGGLSARRGLTNGKDSSEDGLGPADGLINGLPSKGPTNPVKAKATRFARGRRERAARRVLGRKAREPLPGAGGD